MNSQEWSKLRKNWTAILDLYPSEIYDPLYENGIFTHRDKEGIKEAGPPHEQMDKLMSILKSKPADMNAYRCFMTAVQKSLPELAEKIEATESDCDPSLIADEDPHSLDEDVRKILHENFVSKEGAEIQLREIRNTLNEHQVFKLGKEWKNEILEKFLKTEFVGVKTETRNKRKGKTKAKVIYVINLENIETQKTQDNWEQKTESVSSKPKVDEKSDLKKMDKIQLKHFLQDKFKDKDFPTEILDKLEQEMVGGEEFLTMTESDFKEIHPTIPWGTRRFLAELIKTHSCPPNISKEVEYLRKFDKSIEATDKYVKGRCVDISVNIRSKSTVPVRNFHLLQEQDEDKALEYIGAEVIPFASACLNDRRNGTIYFGISPKHDQHFKAGEIVGVSLLKEEIEAELQDFRNKSFSSTQKNIVSKAVRDVKLVPVISYPPGQKDSDLFVVEIDIVPSSELLQEDTVRTKLKHLPLYQKKDKSKTAVFNFSDDGLPQIIASCEDLTEHERDKPRIVQQRRMDETYRTPEYKPQLRRKFLRLLTGGKERLEDTVYIFAMTSPIDAHMDEDYLLENISFLKRPEIVFDFDPKGATNGICKNLDSKQNEVMRILTTNNFDKSQVTKDEYKDLTDGLANEHRTCWVFCNGHEDMNIEPMDPVRWNQKRRSTFEEALHYFTDNFGEDRVIILICLFSKDYTTMIEACDDVVTKFSESWMLLAESEDLAKLWQEHLLSRNRVQKEDLNDRCVIGMPWAQVNATMQQVMGNTVAHKCFLPCSTGALIEVKEKMIKGWSNIDVLTAGDFELPSDENEKKKMEVEVEQKFYKGEQADWLNFLFNDHVMKRDIHSELMETVRIALMGKGKEEEDKVTVVPILHHPGAGGTTSAMQILWDLRKVYRCCIVRTITDQTCDQLESLRYYSDRTPNPLLVLIDNEDEEKYSQLKGNLEDSARKHWRQGDESLSVYCTIILCTRRGSLPKQLKGAQIALRQELTRNELDWFKNKNESLESRYKTDSDANIHPKFLIAFNILRENFNKEYVSKVVQEFTDAVQKPHEIKLLKVVSLLNNYDPYFQPIRVSSLDKYLEREQGSGRGRGNKARELKWEALLSEGVKVLLNLASSRGQNKERKSVRVINKIVAMEILSRMQEQTKEMESEMILELLESDVFEVESVDSRHLQSMINRIFKSREYKPDGKGKEKFSTFVSHLLSTEGVEVAANILEHLFDLNKDPFTAQLISRVYIEAKNWERAKQFAEKATRMLPSNSFVWDTYGQVFKNQLSDKIAPAGPQEFSKKEMHEIISLSTECIKAFRQEQKVSEEEITTMYEKNLAGYFGELRATVALCSALKMCPPFNREDVLHRYLVDRRYSPPGRCFLNDQEAEYLKNLESKSKEAMRRLDEECLQMKSSSSDDTITASSELNIQNLLDLKVKLDEYFGETGDSPPQNLSVSQASDYRRRRARYLGAESLNFLLNLRRDNQIQTIKKIYYLLLQNVNSEEYTFEDIKAILGAVTVLSIDKHEIPGLKYDTVLSWCRMLLSMNRPDKGIGSHLEKYLYFVLYNFPTQDRQRFKLCPIRDLSNEVKNWYDSFKQKYPRHEEGDRYLKRRETTLFFLGNGKALHDVVYQDALDQMGQYSLQEKWRLPEVREKLMLSQGMLHERGEKVIISLTNKEGNRFDISIPTSHRVTNRDLWQKRVFFYIGFSFSGPLAFGMSLEELGIAQVPQTSTGSGAAKPIQKSERFN